jgi:GMP synthase (glutamine-hydrolysing)
MTSVTAVRHVAFEDLGTLEDIFAARQWKADYVEAPVADWTKVDLLRPDLLVVLGGPIGANDEARYPFLAHELKAIEKRLAAGKPTLGICLGSQLIAKCLGAAVYPAREREIGWAPLLLTRNGLASPMKHLAAEHAFMFHWHGDTFDLPKDAVLLAGTATALHQIFTWGSSTLAIQCHPEVRGHDLEKWFVGNVQGLGGIDVRHLRADTARYAPALEKQAALCFGQWLDSLTLS